ncbi:MAG: ABC transporter permease [Anaerolineae bacterium]|nr:ABC transporter permease [Anaerolineae bacterium]
MSASAIPTPAKRRRTRGPLAKYLNRNRRAISALAIFAVLLIIFTMANPRIFTNPITYRAIFLSLPISLFVVVPLVFIVASGEIDLSFPATAGITSWVFSAAVQSGWEPVAALIPALLLGVVVGLVVGGLVTYVGLSSLVATLGMNFLMRGIINMGTQGVAIQFPQMRTTALWQAFAGRIEGFPVINGFPVHMLWGLGFVALGWMLFNRHRLGIRVQIVGDNPDSAAEMGITVARVKIGAFVFLGIGAALSGVLSVLVNQNWWPTTGDGLLLPALAAVFVGGTPTWGGIGTVVGSSIGAFIIAFIETGIIGAGLTGYVTQFFNGLVIILSLIGHRFNGRRYR